MPARGYIHVYMCVHLFVVLQVGESVLYYPQLHRKYQQDVQNGQLCAPGTNPFKLGKGGVKSPHSFIHSFIPFCLLFLCGCACCVERSVRARVFSCTCVAVGHKCVPVRLCVPLRLCFSL